jgi:hypothetical protein
MIQDILHSLITEMEILTMLMSYLKRTSAVSLHTNSLKSLLLDIYAVKLIFSILKEKKSLRQFKLEVMQSIHFYLSTKDYILS